jgi:AcrR family transcriptional regulator
MRAFGGEKLNGVALVEQGQADDSRPSTQERIREVAVRLFAQKGFEATGIRDIADQAGVKTSALYHYMNSKEDLLVDIMDSILKKLILAAQDSLVGALTPATRLVALVRSHVGLHAYEKLSALVGDGELRALSDEKRKQVVHLRDEYEDLWARTLRDGIGEGMFRIENATITRLALLEMCNGVSRWYSEAGTLAVGDVADTFAELALALVDATEKGKRVHLKDLKCPPANDVLKIVRRALQSNMALMEPI